MRLRLLKRMRGRIRIWDDDLGIHPNYSLFVAYILRGEFLIYKKFT